MSRLEADFSGASALIHQMYIHINSLLAYPLAVVVPCRGAHSSSVLPTLLALAAPGAGAPACAFHKREAEERGVAACARCAVMQHGMRAAAELRAQYAGHPSSPQLKAALRMDITELARKQALQVPVSHTLLVLCTFVT